MPDQQAHRHLTDVDDSTRLAKRQKRATNDDSPVDTQITRKGKACSICRKLKIKCDAGERGMGSCSRCRRLNLTCLSEKRSWTNADGDEFQNHQLVLGKLEMALADVLDKLGLPSLDLYVQPAIVGSQHPERPTRGNSEDRDDERDVSPGPMNSLIEATQLNGLRSQLRSIKQRRAGGMRRMHSDLIAEKLIDHREAEEMLDLFKFRLSQHMFSATIPAEANLEGIRTSSTVLFTAIILVTALHIPGREQLHERCHARFLGLVSAMMFDKFHTLDDIRGICIAAFWQPDISWKLSGLGVRMATELNLHYAFHEAFHPDTSEEDRNYCLEKARLWYLLYVLDHQSSITYGRPSTMAELRPIKDYGFLLNSQWLLPADRALLAQVTGFGVLNKAFEMFGLEPKRTMSGDDSTILNHQRFTDDVVAWREKWVRPKTNGSFAADYLARGVELHYHFSNLVLNSMVLRGRPMQKLSEMPSSLRPLALKAIEAAHAILQHFVDEPSYREDLVGMPLHLHSVIAFATVFLLKMSYRWHAIGITIDASRQTIPLIENIIKILRESKAGANHIVFSMATGFERMLKQLRRRHAARAEAKESSGLPVSIPAGPTNDIQPGNKIHTVSGPQYTGGLESGLDAHVAPHGAIDELPHALDIPSISSPGSFTNWGFQDDDLWLVGMGYDLLQPGGQSFTNPDHGSQDFTDMPPMT